MGRSRESRLVGYAKAALLRAMEDYSEDTWCAGWMNKLEFILWRTIQRASREPSNPNLLIGAFTLEEWQHMIQDSGGWWVWDDRDDDNNLVFVPIEEWEEIYKTWPRANHESTSGKGE